MNQTILCCFCLAISQQLIYSCGGDIIPWFTCCLVFFFFSRVILNHNIHKVRDNTTFRFSSSQNIYWSIPKATTINKKKCIFHLQKVQIIAPYKHNSNYCCKWETGVIVELHLASKLEPVGVKYFVVQFCHLVDSMKYFIFSCWEQLNRNPWQCSWLPLIHFIIPLISIRYRESDLYA